MSLAISVRYLSLCVILIGGMGSVIHLQAYPGDNLLELSSRESPFQYITNELLSIDNSTWIHHTEPTMAIGDDDIIYVGWKEAEEHDGGGKGVAFTHTIDGEEWSYPVVMDPAWSTGSIQSDPWMEYFNGTLYYSYLESPTGSEGQGQITFAHTNDSGQRWTQVRATFGGGDYADKETFSISDDGTIYLVYSDTHIRPDDSYTRVKLSRSYDGGNSFVENTTINDINGVDVGAFVMANKEGEVVVVWTHYVWDFATSASPQAPNSSIFVDRSEDGGNTFGKDRDMIPQYNAAWSYRNPENNRSAKHSLAILDYDAKKDRLYTTWADVSADVTNPETSWDVYMRYSDNFGMSWSDSFRVNKFLHGNQWNPDFEFDSHGNLHFIYYDETQEEGRHLKHRVYYPKTYSFSEEMIVTTQATSPNLTRPGEYMSIRFDSNDVPHIVWTDGRNGELDIYYARAEVLWIPTLAATNQGTLLFRGWGMVFLLIPLVRPVKNWIKDTRF